MYDTLTNDALDRQIAERQGWRVRRATPQEVAEDDTAWVLEEGGIERAHIWNNPGSDVPAVRDAAWQYFMRDFQDGPRDLPHWSDDLNVIVELAGQAEITGRWTFLGISPDLENGVGVIWEAAFSDQEYPHNTIIECRHTNPARAVAVAWLLMDDACSKRKQEQRHY